MKFATAALAAIVSSALMCQAPLARANEEEDAAKISALIANYAKQLDVGTVSLNWYAQPEVGKFRAFGDLKRSAAILATIWDLGKNDEEIFSRMKSNDYQILVSMLTRIRAYTFLNDLIGRSANDAVLKDYLDQEVIDLKKVFARKNTVAAYLQARKIRDDKLAVLLKDQKFVAELVKFRAGKETVAKSLANVTTMLALIETCTANTTLCVKLD